MIIYLQGSTPSTLAKSANAWEKTIAAATTFIFSHLFYFDFAFMLGALWKRAVLVTGSFLKQKRTFLGQLAGMMKAFFCAKKVLFLILLFGF